MKTNAANERIKRTYLRFLREAKGRDEATIDAVAKSLARFENSTGRRDFKRFHREQAVAFKGRLAVGKNARTGEGLSKGTILSTLRHLRDFFAWLSREPGYRSQVAYADADYFNLPDKDVAVAQARREKPVPTLDQMEQVLTVLPGSTVLERRDRAVVALAVLTGARVAALASLRRGDLNLAEVYVDQDARHVRTKFGKTFRTWLKPVSPRALEIVRAWALELDADPGRGPAGPLFPATAMGRGPDNIFVPDGLSDQGWSGSGPIRDIFKRAFALAKLPYFNPHSLRDMLVRYAMSLRLTPEAMKAWSQNLGHKAVLTTLTSYGHVPAHRQAELIASLGRLGASNIPEELRQRVLAEFFAEQLAANGTMTRP
jgi:integrase